MAIANENMLVNHYHGRTGNVVFRRRGKKTVAAKRPDFSRRVLSELQKESNERFRKAMNWARKAKEDPELWEFYSRKRKGSQKVFNVAVRDYLSRPSVRKIDICQYNGEAGNLIVIHVNDIYFVKEVKLSILDSSGRELESGNAVAHDLSCFVWNYTATSPNPEWQSGTFMASVRDIPGNVAVAVLERDPADTSLPQPSAFPPSGYAQDGNWKLKHIEILIGRRKGGREAGARRKKARQWWKIWQLG
jgi:hypothetical protein